MESTEKRHIKSGKEYDHLFPKPDGTVELVKENATLDDTLKLLPKVIRDTLYQTKKIAAILKGKTVEETCEKIWDFVSEHIKYVPDPKGKEWVRSPQVTWAERQGDCEDYSLFISSCLCNLNIIPHRLRVALYKLKNGFQHIYPVAIEAGGKNKVVVDCVVKDFNYEEPYLIKKDIIMDLYYLNGIGSMNQKENNSIDAEDLFSNEMGELGKWSFKDSKFAKSIKAGVQNIKQNVNAGVQNIKQNVTASNISKGIKNGLHAINKVNPATALLRLGVLASMKLNLFKVAGRLKYAYLSEAEAKKKGFYMDKYSRLKTILKKITDIFHGAGGEEKNLKEAILTGKGNSTREVALSGIGKVDYSNYNENTPLSRIIGENSYDTEMQTVEGLGGTLGEPATGAAIAAATTVIAAIAQLIKSIGPLRKGDDGSSDNTTSPGGDTSTTNTDTPNANTGADTGAGTNENTDTGANTTTPGQSTDTANNSNGGANSSSDGNGTDTPAGGDGSDSGNETGDNSNKRTALTTNNTLPATTDKSADDTTPPQSSWDKIKKWVKENPVAATGAGVGAVVVIGGVSYGIYKLVTRGKKQKSKSENISGVPGRKHKKTKKHHHHQSAKVKFMRLKG